MLLVTGAAGFIGSRLIARLAQEGEQPHALARDAGKAKKTCAMLGGTWR